MKCNCFLSYNANQRHEKGNKEVNHAGWLQAVLKLCSFCGRGGHTSSDCGKRKR